MDLWTDPLEAWKGWCPSSVRVAENLASVCGELKNADVNADPLIASDPWASSSFSRGAEHVEALTAVGDAWKGWSPSFVTVAQNSVDVHVNAGCTAAALTSDVLTHAMNSALGPHDVGSTALAQTSSSCHTVCTEDSPRCQGSLTTCPLPQSSNLQACSTGAALVSSETLACQYRPKRADESDDLEIVLNPDNEFATDLVDLSLQLPESVKDTMEAAQSESIGVSTYEVRPLSGFEEKCMALSELKLQHEEKIQDCHNSLLSACELLDGLQSKLTTLELEANAKNGMEPNLQNDPGCDSDVSASQMRPEMCPDLLQGLRDMDENISELTLTLVRVRKDLAEDFPQLAKMSIEKIQKSLKKKGATPPALFTKVFAMNSELEHQRRLRKEGQALLDTMAPQVDIQAWFDRVAEHNRQVENDGELS